jgi:hypothetical protein
VPVALNIRRLRSSASMQALISGQDSTDVLSAAAWAAVVHTSVQASAAANGATAQRLHDGAHEVSGWRTQRA